MVKVLKNFFALLSFLTPIPLPHRLRSNTLVFGSLYLLPIIGLIRGLFTILPLYILYIVNIDAPFLATFTVIAMHYIMQGFLHADGFIDFSEAVLAYRFGVDAYRVVKDRYRGSYAIAVFMIFVLGLYSSVLSILIKTRLEVSIVLIISAEVWSIVSMPTLSYLGREPPEGIGRLFKHSVRDIDVLLGIAIAVALTTVLMFSVHPMIAPLLTMLLAVGFTIAVLSTHLLSSRVLGFVNGDVLGFVSELCYLMVMAIHAVGANLWI
ncbi:MAG: adenosylcobinamide-GDP ribazoletransferase [Ignisphaera sp.]